MNKKNTAAMTFGMVMAAAYSGMAKAFDSGRSGRSKGGEKGVPSTLSVKERERRKKHTKTAYVSKRAQRVKACIKRKRKQKARD